MKNLYFSFIFITLAFCVNAQSDSKIEIGKIDSIQSKILNEKRKIMVYVPTRSAESDYGKQRYPVIYSLDGDINYFTMLAGTVRFLSTIYDPVFSESIVVSIPNTDRTRELTPSHNADSPEDSTSGGGEKFISFIEKELIPYIDDNYPTTAYKTLSGGSLAGLLGMQVFIHHTNLFNAYICTEPSMWWDNQTLLKETEKALATNKFNGKSLFIGIANTMEDGTDINSVIKDTTNETIHIRSILQLRNALENNKENGLNFQSKYYNNETHATIGLISQYDALHFIFKDYNLKITEKDITDKTISLLEKCKQHYANYKTVPPGSKTNDIGYWALYLKQFKKAEELFKYNLDRFPESYKVYVAMGDYYAAIDDKTNAINNYKKSLAIQEIEDIRKKLEKIQVK
jgi:predicted alpha/beta superfamily hydrolase